MTTASSLLQGKLSLLNLWPFREGISIWIMRLNVCQWFLSLQFINFFLVQNKEKNPSICNKVNKSSITSTLKRYEWFKEYAQIKQNQIVKCNLSCVNQYFLLAAFADLYLPMPQVLLTSTVLFFLINVTNLYLNYLQTEIQSASVQ